MTRGARLLDKGRDLISLIRLTEFDTTTEHGRSRERARRMMLTSLGAFAAKLLSMIALAVSVPLTLHYLGQERYGLWMTISSLLMMIKFADLGMGNGILTMVSQFHGQNDRESAQRCVSSGFFMLCLVGIVLLAAFAVAYPFMRWERVFNLVSPQAIHEAGPAVAILFGSFAISMPLGIVQRAQNGLQEGFQNNLWQCLGSMLSLGALFAAVHARAGLPWLVLAAEGATVFTTLLNGASFFGWRHRWLAPAARFWSWPDARQLFRTGVLFLVVQVAVAAAITSNNIVIAQVLGAKAVAQYAVVARLFSIVSIISNMLLMPMWPAYGEALARGDVVWIKTAFQKAMKVAVATTIFASVVLALAGGVIIHHWVGTRVLVSESLLIGFACWTIAETVSNVCTPLLNGTQLLRFQAVCVVACAVVGLAAKIVLARFMGTSGVVWGTALAFAVCVVAPFLVRINKYLQHQTARSEPELVLAGHSDALPG